MTGGQAPQAPEMIVPTAPKKRGGWRPGAGRPVRTDWQERYLEHLTDTGTRVWSAKAAEVDYGTVVAELERNPDFARAVERALDVYADGLEILLRDQGRGVVKGNPLPIFALLKRHRPELYHEKLVSLSVTANVDIPPEQALQVLQAMLRSTTPTTRRLIAQEPQALASGEQGEPR